MNKKPTKIIKRGDIIVIVWDIPKKPVEGERAPKEVLTPNEPQRA